MIADCSFEIDEASTYWACGIVILVVEGCIVSSLDSALVSDFSLLGIESATALLWVLELTALTCRSFKSLSVAAEMVRGAAFTSGLGLFSLSGDDNGLLLQANVPFSLSVSSSFGSIFTTKLDQMLQVQR